MNVRELYWQRLTECKDLARYLDNKLKPFYCPLQQKNNHGIYAVNINAKVGFFAQLTWCIYIFHHCERFNLTPYVVLSSPFYSVSEDGDWFEYFFDNLKLTETDRKKIKNGTIKISNISSIEQMGLPIDCGTHMSIGHASRLLEKNLRINGEIQDYVDSFVDKHFGNKTVLGIHYRGTDKQFEAKRVSKEFCAITISNYLASNSQIDALFVSSDEWDFIEWIESKFKQVEVISHDDKERSSNSNAVHTQPALGDNYAKGKEALVNCLLLSKCNALIRTASFLSAWSSIFNPHIPVIMLNKPNDDKLWFPDAEIIKTSMNEYLPDQSDTYK
jgi:hypothetical protein